MYGIWQTIPYCEPQNVEFEKYCRWMQWCITQVLVIVDPTQHDATGHNLGQVVIL